MRIEISSAANFLVDLVRLNNTKTLNNEQLERFRSNVSDILQRHYTNHWFPDKPFKGSGYRCIRINGKMDPLIARAGFMMGLAVSFLRSLFPSELTMWVDPREVSYRIGENGSICILYEGVEKIIKKGEELPSTSSSSSSSSTTTATNNNTSSAITITAPPELSAKTPAEKSAPSSNLSQQAPSPPPALPQHHQPPTQQQQQQVQQQQHHHHQQHQQQHQHHQQQQQHHHHHHQQQQHHHHHHHFSPSKPVVAPSSTLHQQQSPPMSPVTSQQHAAATAMQLSMFLMNKDSGLIKCKESLQRGLEARTLQMDRLFVSS